MSSLLFGFLMLCSVAMVVLVLLIIFLSASLLIFARAEKKAEGKIKAFMEAEESTR
jgi:hypothetical protein